MFGSKEATDCRAVPACSTTSYVNEQGFGKTFVPNFVTDITPDNVRAKGNARIMIVGESPDDMEDQLGRPFSGPVHGMIENALHQARPGGISRDDVYFTSVLKCRAVDVNPETGILISRAPYPDEVEACKPLLEKEIDVVNPDVIVAMGGTAIKALTGEELVKNAIKDKVLLYRGKGGQNTFVVPTYHPMESKYLIKASDIEGAARVQQQRNGAFKRAATLAAIENESRGSENG